MPLVQTDIKVFKSVNISDTSFNGGDMTTLELADVVGALFPNIDNTERLNGSTKWRKVFFKLHNDGLLPLISARLYQDQDTTGTDTILMAKATSLEDTQNDLPVSPDLYGSLPIQYSVSSGVTSLLVSLPTGILNFYRIGDTLRISDKNLTTGIGNEEFVVITDVTVSGTDVTIDFLPSLNSSYGSTTARVMNVIEYGDLYAKASDLSVTSAAGTFDLSKVDLNNRSTVNALWTLTFTSATNYTVESTVLAAPVNGNLTTAPTLTNATYSLPFLTINVTAFGGNFSNGNIITFITTPAAIPIWLKRIVPAGATPIAANKATFVLDGGTV